MHGNCKIKLDINSINAVYYLKKRDVIFHNIPFEETNQFLFII